MILLIVSFVAVLIAAGFYLERLNGQQAGWILIWLAIGSLICFGTHANPTWYWATPAILSFYLIFKLGLASIDIPRPPWYI